MRKETGEERWIAPVEKIDRTFVEALQKSIKTPFSMLQSTVEGVTGEILTGSPLDYSAHGFIPGPVVRHDPRYTLPVFRRDPIYLPRTIRLVSIDNTPLVFLLIP